ncbi:MAG TPA: hypothetical protein VJ276_03425, partial [Thermoanaerobaculia bacterium]|nr:hypothetical protein [Thermoanaerobaculia bacterium]
MIAALIVIAMALLLGIPLVTLLDRSLRGPLRLGVAFIVGLAAYTLLLLTGMEWTRLSLFMAWPLAVACAWAFARPRFAWPGRPHSLLLIAAIELAGYTLFATIGPLWEFDFLADWGLKGRVYALAQGVDWTFLQAAWYRATHADYPPLIPLAFDLVAIVNGGWEDRWIGLLYPAFALAGVAIAYGAAREEVGERWAALIAVIVLPLCATPWLGLADGPFAVTVLAAIVGERASRPPAGGRLARRRSRRRSR